MATFKAKEGALAYVNGKILKFVDGKYTTTDKKEVAALQGAKGISEVKGASKAS